MADLPIVTLRDPSSPLTATFVPAAGMVGTSLSDDGVELLGQRRGLDAYLSTGKTMGIPILYPWANRLSANSYAVDGSVVTLTPGTGGVRTDEHGVPIHGVLAAYPGWHIAAQSENKLTAVLDFGSRPPLLASFPFPHLLTLDVSLADRALTVRTTVTPSTGASVPLCFGFHPYLQLPDVPRAQWQVDTPDMRHCQVDAWGIPTGVTQPHPATSETLGDKVLDHGYDEVQAGAVFGVSAGDRHIEVCFEEGYPAAQVFAPAGDDVIAFEPMAAPTNALRRGNYRVANPGQPATAAFSIRVS
jgi:galactose mutarotase-like enzyme